MRMWMVDPTILCRQHLLGEHLECHMFGGTLKQKIKMDGYIQNNLFEPSSLISRHNILAEEMLRREMKHVSVLELPNDIFKYLPPNFQNRKVNVVNSLDDLIRRCPRCRARYQLIIDNGQIPLTDKDIESIIYDRNS